MPALIKSKYSLGSELFRDSVSRTFNASEASTGRALLVCRYESQLITPLVVQRLIEQAERLLTVRATGTAVLVDYYYDGNHFYSIYESPGEVHTLLRHLKSQPSISIQWLNQQALAVVAAAADLEKHGLWHGDINLSSILLTKSGELILIHPMLHAELIRNSLPKLSKMDTAMFMAPEQLNQAAGNGRCDMYAIGVLLFLFFSNQWPIPFSTDLATIRQNILGEPIPFRKINQGVSDLIGDVISTCLAKLPSERFPSVATLRSRISNVLIPEPGPGRPDIADAQPTPTAALESAIDTESSFLNSLLTRRNGMVAVAISVAFLILFVIYRIYVGYVTALPVSIVPELKGLSVAEATRLLEEQHLRAEVAGQRADYSVPDGAIVEMRPAAGREVKQDRIILLYVAKHGTAFTVPDFVGQTVAQAQAELPDPRATITVSSEIYSLKIPKGEIVSQSPSPNAVTSPNAPIQVVVSKGLPVEVSVNQAANGKAVVQVRVSVLADWPPQQVVINYRNGAGSKQLLAQKLMPTDAENFEFNLELGGDIEVLFNDRLALRQRVQELIPSAKNGKP